MTDAFTPDYRHFEAVMQNRRPDRLPLYEHIVSPKVMEEIQGQRFAALGASTDPADLAEFARHYGAFFRAMTYDTVSFEVCITSILPDGGALKGGKPGPIQSRDDFDAYPWAELPARFRQAAYPRFDAMVAALPAGMKLVGGVGNGIFEISEDLVGLEYLPFMQVDDPDLHADIYTRIGELTAAIWREFLPRYGEHFVACRMGDDLGFKDSLLTNPRVIREHIVPQYRRVIDLTHAHDKPFLWHSCGCIFAVMDDFIKLGIDAKHSNEDAIAPFTRWIDDYSDRIGLLGGYDMDVLCTRTPDEIKELVLATGRQYREAANGYALGSGNSIPDYVPAENYLAMVEAGRELRG